MDSTSLTKPVDLQGLSLALAKTKADYEGKINHIAGNLHANVIVLTDGIDINNVTSDIGADVLYNTAMDGYFSGNVDINCFPITVIYNNDCYAGSIECNNKNITSYTLFFGDYACRTDTSPYTEWSLVADIGADWLETDNYSKKYIQNKPAIIAGEGENSVMIGQIEQDEEARTYHLTVTLPASSAESTDTFTFSTEDDLSEIASLSDTNKSYLFCLFEYTYTITSTGEVKNESAYRNIEDIDIANQTFIVNQKFYGNDRYTYSPASVTLYYKNKIVSSKYGIAEGRYTVATGLYSHAEGTASKAMGAYSHAEGSLTVATKNIAHAEGYRTKAFGSYSHTEGCQTKASGSYSHAEGGFTIASGSGQHVQGKYNIEDSEDIYADIVGNGTSSARSNAYTLDWNGNGWYAGKVSAGTVESPANPTAANDLVTKAYVDAATAGVSPNLSDLADTDISNPQVDQVLMFHERSGKWANMNLPNGFVTTLSDTNISNPADGQVLQYDATSYKWVNATLPTGVTETRVNELIAAALAQYGDGDTATYGYTDASEVNY